MLGSHLKEGQVLTKVHQALFSLGDVEAYRTLCDTIMTPDIVCVVAA